MSSSNGEKDASEPHPSDNDDAKTHHVYKGGDGSFDKNGGLAAPADGVPKETVVHIDVDSSVTTIGKGAFCECKNLQTIRIPETVTSIGQGAFRGCSSLTTIKIPESVKSISDGAFFKCYSLSTIQIPKSVTSIGDRTFHKCLSLVDMTIPESVTSIGEYSFYSCSSLANIKIPESVISIGKSAFRLCSSLAIIQIPELVTSISDGAFLGCSSLGTIQIPNSVTSIGNYAYRDCSSVASIQIPESVTFIGDFAFRGCSSLATIHIPESEKSIGRDAFADCAFAKKISKAQGEDNKLLLNLFEDLPLHKLCNQKSNEKLSVQKINQHLIEIPDATKCFDAVGRTPLHILAMNPCVTIDLLDCFLKHNETMVTQEDHNGLRPLHYLCGNRGASKETIIKLIQECPQSLGDVAVYYGVPLKLAIWNELSDDKLHCLFDSHPVGYAFIRDENKLELESLARGFIERLKTKLNPPVEETTLKSPVKFNSIEQHGWVTFVSTKDVLGVGNDKLEEKCIQFIENCDDESIVKLLARAMNFSGSQAIQIAIPNIQKALKERLLFLGRYTLVTDLPIYKSATCVVVKAYDENKLDEYGEIFDTYVSKRKGQKNLIKNDLEDILKNVGLNAFDKQLADNFFSKYDLNDDKSMSKDEFVNLCHFEFDRGQKHEVVFKFTKDEKQFCCEKNSRTILGNKNENKYVVSVIKAYSKDNADDNSDISSALKDVVPDDFKMYQRALLMPYAERDLHAIFLSERPDIGRIRDYTKQIAEALQHLHNNSIIHGDLKPLNIVRLGGRMVLIDLDASVEMNSYAGCNFSSGVLPPEMIYSIDNEDDFNKFKNYFKNEEISDSKSEDDILSRWEKIEPKKLERTGYYVVKTFNVRKDAEKNWMGDQEEVEVPVDPNKLPYKLVEATHAFDAWSLGTILYTLLKGKPLFPVNRDGNLEDARAMKELYDWDDTMMEKKLNEGRSIPAQAKYLLQKLLQRKPTERLKMEAVLDHGFFHNVDASLDKKFNEMKEQMSEGFEEVLQGQQIIMNMSEHMQDELSRTRSILLCGMFEATEVKTPTAFVITKKRVPEVKTSSKSTGEKFSIEFQEHFGEVNLWTRRVADICKGAHDRNVGGIFGIVKEGLSDLVTGDEMYFYFIDELTGEPVLGSGYPKVITTPSELVPKLLPLMQVSMRAVSICNGAAGIARMFGFPLPQIPQEVSADMQESVDILKQESSVEKFGPLKSVVNDLQQDSEEQESSNQNVRGESLRQLLKFLKTEIENKEFAGLNRYPDPRSGKAIWTTLKTTEEVEKAIEKISEDRRKEEVASLENKDEANGTAKQEVERLIKELQISKSVNNVSGQHGGEEDILLESNENEACESVEDLKCKLERKQDVFIREFKSLKRQIHAKETGQELETLLNEISRPLSKEKGLSSNDLQQNDEDLQKQLIAILPPGEAVHFYPEPLKCYPL